MRIDKADLRYGDTFKVLAADGFSEEQIERLPSATLINSLSHQDNGSIRGRYRASDDRECLVDATSWQLVELVGSDDTVTDMGEQVLQRKIMYLEGDLDNARQRVADHQMAIVLVNDRMLEEADARGWCETFDEIIQEVNVLIRDKANGVHELRGCKQTFTVNISGTMTLDFEREIEIEARNEDEAREYAENDMSLQLGDIDSLAREALAMRDPEVNWSEIELDVYS